MAADHAPDLGRDAANHVPLSPVSFLRRAADTWPGKVAVRHGELAFTWAQVEALDSQVRAEIEKAKVFLKVTG